ncbi:hypothetical protein EDC04DRAFT_2599612 [Pisolithus marmoratus]|nr:hypothetical protein EDC04DRAFT_2599612 [Pisolithus marmoratus]
MASKAPLHLHILVIGGCPGLGIMFLSSRNRELEKWVETMQKVCGLRVPPNLTRILDEWGLGEELSRYGSTTTGSELDTGDLLGHFTWQEAVMDEIGARFFLMHYQDLHNIPYQAATSAGVHVSFSTPVIQVETHPPRVRLATGEVIHADLVIGVDGLEGITREVVEGCKVKDAVDKMGLTWRLFMAARAAIPRDQLKKDPDLTLLRAECGGPQRGGSEYMVHLFWSDDLENRGDYLLKDLDVAITREKLGITDLWDSWIFVLPCDISVIPPKEPPYSWADSFGRIVLMGAAAHPSFPCITHGTSLHVEEAKVFGWLLSRLHSVEQLPHLLQGFQDIREERCRTVRGLAITWPATRHAGSHVASYDAARRWDKEDLRVQWEALSRTFGYNAREDVEDWWVSWGYWEKGVLKSRQFASSLNAPFPNFSG